MEFLCQQLVDLRLEVSLVRVRRIYAVLLEHIEEVERLADQVAIIDKGRIQLDESAESLQQRFRSVEVVLEQESPPTETVPGTWINLQQAGRSVRYVDTSFDHDGQLDLIRNHFPNALRHDAQPMSLRAIFVALARTYRLSTNPQTT